MKPTPEERKEKRRRYLLEWNRQNRAKKRNELNAYMRNWRSKKPAGYVAEACKRWRDKNPDQVSYYSAKYYAKHAQELIQKAKEEYWQDPERCRIYWKDYPEKRMLSACKRNAKNRGVPFNLEVSSIVIPEYCPVFGFKLERGKGKGRPI
jgi:hypothetical protein